MRVYTLSSVSDPVTQTIVTASMIVSAGEYTIPHEKFKLLSVITYRDT